MTTPKKTFSINKNSNLKHVLVYQDQAELNRTIQTIINKGSTEILITDISPFMIIDSLKLSCNSDIIDVSCRKSPLNDTKKSEYENLKNQIQNETLKIDRINKNLKLLVDFGRNFCVQSKNPDEFLNFLDLYEKKINFYSNEKTSCQTNLTKLNEKFNLIKLDLEIPYHEILIYVQTEDDFFKLDLNFSYLVSNATWTPKYDFKFLIEEKVLRVNFNAIISQATKEDWENTNVTISNRCLRNNLESQLVRFKGPEAKNMQQLLEEMRSHIENKVKNSKLVQTSKNDFGFFCSTFDLNEKISLKSESFSDRLFFRKLELQTEFVNESFPRKFPNVMLKSKIKNVSDFCIFSGEANVYVDNKFLGRRQINNCMPMGDFEMHLGFDSRIKIDYKPLRVYKSKTGLVDKKSNMTYVQAIEVKNNADEKIKIFLRDFLPMSSDEKIQVKLSEPNLKNQNNVKMNKNNVLEFELDLNSGEKDEILIKYSIEYPSDRIIEFF
ncbi:unnamed protein product [Brachionus calyciflorus]|uniref:DUF4139 domain-containing protein n=1 Tax=Brachionus calyciflorus TaxID=104777 RepID=A0A814GHH8_9BILA|nr:unnamed protein product [Brachionus calyciflorus]